MKFPFQLNASRTNAVFDLIHLDTWGAYRVCTRGKFKYFLTLIDDHSHMTWLYLMQNKYDFSACFKEFCNYVKN